MTVIKRLEEWKKEFNPLYHKEFTTHLPLSLKKKTYLLSRLKVM